MQLHNMSLNATLVRMRDAMLVHPSQVCGMSVMDIRLALNIQCNDSNDFGMDRWVV